MQIKELCFVLFSSVMLGNGSSAFAQWKPAGDKIRTPWADQIDPSQVLPEYPRPIMERERWKNLNGLWQYAITDVNAAHPETFEGEILVPFAVESSLSGVERRVNDTHALWYNRQFTVPSDWKGENILLNFGGVDWKADVWVNDIKVGQHTGGYTSFSFDITAALRKGNNQLTVRVWDPSDKGEQPRGKQVERPGGIWYTPVTGIWQTVWLEPVSDLHITRVKTTPDLDRRMLRLDVQTNQPNNGIVEVKVMDKDRVVASASAVAGQPLDIHMLQDVKLWSPDSPFLYTTEVILKDRHQKEADKVQSYAALRKFSTRRDADGIVRFQLNNKDIFLFAPLDQGWWPDGLYTAPTDEALKYDIQKIKDFGFNTIRKHVKVEPARWYTYCDQMGLIVWQDMPNGGRGPVEWWGRAYYTGPEAVRSAESEANYRKEWKEIIDDLYSYPSVGIWTPFNECWGQFKTVEIAEWTKKYDPTRLVDPASGGNHYQCGDMLDLHNYPQPHLDFYDAQRATVLGEYGGIGLPMKGHLWTPDKNWGYVKFNTPAEVTAEYVKYAEKLLELVKKGFSAAVYTQITDVEEEVNGLITYDRKQIKVEEDKIRTINLKLSKCLNR